MDTNKETLECMILDENFNVTAIIDSYESFIWTDRFNTCGDFEIYFPAVSPLREQLKKEYYIYNPESEHLMIIDGSELTTDVENGDHITTTGRSIESILDRRIIYKEKTVGSTKKVIYTKLNGSLQDGIETILNENVIFPNVALQDQPRKLELFEFEKSTDPNITKLSYNGQFLGETVYDAICTICENNKLGWKAVWNQERNKFVISLYFGKDRSYDQLENNDIIYYKLTSTAISANWEIRKVGAGVRKLYHNNVEVSINATSGLDSDNEKYFKETFLDTSVLEVTDKDNYQILTYKKSNTGYRYALFLLEDIRYLALNPFVIFSPEYDNLLTSDFIDNNNTYKNFTLIGGEEITVNNEKQKTFSTYGEGVGMNRREIYTDANGTSSSNNDQKMSDAEYQLVLKEQGVTTLNENKVTDTFEGTIAEYGMFIINKDYFIGDLIQLENAYGKRKVARVTEMIFSKDNDGYKIYPTYEVDAVNEEYTIKYISDDNGSLILGACAPTKAKYGESFVVSKPTDSTGRYFSYWNISGLDDSEHFYGDDEEKNESKHDTTLTNINKVWFKNLRQTAGEVVFSAHFTGTKPTEHGDITIEYDLAGGAWNGDKTIYNPTTMHFGSGYNVSHPIRNDDEWEFDGWSITGMDNSEHEYGTTKNNAIKTTESTLLTKATWYRNLRSTSGTVKFTAVWV